MVIFFNGIREKTGRSVRIMGGGFSSVFPRWLVRWLPSFHDEEHEYIAAWLAGSVSKGKTKQDVQAPPSLGPLESRQPVM